MNNCLEASLGLKWNCKTQLPSVCVCMYLVYVYPYNTWPQASWYENHLCFQYLSEVRKVTTGEPLRSHQGCYWWQYVFGRS